VQDVWAHFFIIVCHEMASHTPRTQEGAELSVLRSLDLRAHSFDVVAVASIEAEGGSHDQDVAIQSHLHAAGYSFHGRIMRTLWFVRNGFSGAQCREAMFSRQEAALHAQRSRLSPPSIPRSSSTGSESFALFALAREEHRYIVQWVLYHLALGVDTIYIYDNEDLPMYHLLFAHHPQVVVIHVHMARLVQVEMMEHFLATHSSRHTWASHIDLDEFLNVRPGSGFADIRQFLRHHIPVRRWHEWHNWHEWHDRHDWHDSGYSSYHGPLLL
jgi:hypothetical protein